MSLSKGIKSLEDRASTNSVKKIIMSEKNISIIDHINELRKRIVHIVVWILLGTIVGFLTYDWTIATLIVPFQENIVTEFGKELFVQTLFEGFITKFKLSMSIGVIIALPAIIYHVLRFVFPALRKKERIALILGLLTSIALAAGSCYLTFFKLIPFILTFMTSSGFVPTNVGLMLNFQNSIFYVVQFVIYSLILFQFPILLEILLAYNVLTRQQLIKFSRFVVVGIVIISAIVTPPDVVSQIAISLPLITLYFLSILVAKIFRWGNTCSD